MKQILKDSKWHTWTPHYQSHLLRLHETPYGDLYISDGRYFIRKGTEVTRIPDFAAPSIYRRGGIQMNTTTEQIGKYSFLNGFEKTQEGQYLIDKLRYFRLSAAAQRKVEAIESKYSYWVCINTTYADILRQRDESARVWYERNR